MASKEHRSTRNTRKKDFITFSYVKITPKNLLDADEYNDEFFKILDDIDNKVLNSEEIGLIASQYNLKLETVNNYYPYDKEFELIYSKKETKLDLIESGDNFLLYNIDQEYDLSPDLDDEIIKSEIVELIYQKGKFDYNRKILEEIQKIFKRGSKELQRCSKEAPVTKEN